MFREMRCKELQTSREAAEEMLVRAKNGVIAFPLEDGYPCALPVSHLYFEGALYFHGANAGQKYEVLAGNPKVCFTATLRDDFLPGAFNTHFESVMAYGRACILEDAAEIGRVLRALCKKYEPALTDEAIDQFAAAPSQRGKFCVFKMSIEHLTGKEGI